MKKIIALDIDGTLTNSKKEVTQPTLDKIIEIQKKGHVVAIASGRPLPGIRKIADTLKLDKYEGYVLAFNGGRIVDYKTGEVVYQACVDNDIARRIYDYCVKKKIGMVTYEGDTVITGTPIDEYMSLEARLNFMEIHQVDNFKEYIDFPLNKCLLTAESTVAEQVEQEYRRVSDQLTALQLTLDRANLLLEFEVELEG